MDYTPETLRTVFARSTAKRGKWTLGMLEVELEMHADAWEKDKSRIEALWNENKALRANTSKSVLRRLTEQAAPSKEEK